MKTGNFEAFANVQFADCISLQMAVRSDLSKSSPLSKYSMSQMKMDSDAAKKNASVGLGIWIVLVLIILVWGAYWEWVAPRIKENQFDPLTALFSGLAFWGVIYAILLQKSELVLQREELELTRGEVRGQKEQLEAQNLTMKRQRFENTFFSLLELFSGMVNSMEVTVEMGKHVKGRDCFSRFSYEFDQTFQ